MKTPVRWRMAVVLTAVVLIVSGCARKSRETAPVPTPTPPPPATTAPEKPKPVETPKPAETPPAATPFGSADLQPAFFDFDSYALTDQARAALDQDGKLLRAHSSAKITIEGHCDERGTAEYNQALGEKRAQAARDYLAAAGVEASRIQIISYGKERPFDPGHDEAAWAKNRRAHLVLP